jgi:glutaredoxin
MREEGHYGSLVAHGAQLVECLKGAAARVQIHDEKRGCALPGGGEKSVASGVGLELDAHLPGRLQHLGLEKDVVHQSYHLGHAFSPQFGCTTPAVGSQAVGRRASSLTSSPALGWSIRGGVGSPEMNSIARRVLEAYDELGRDALELSTLAERAAEPGQHAVPAERDRIRAVLRQLVRQGWLRWAGSWDLFARTEEGRLALAGPRELTLYTRPGCHLCEEAKSEIAPLLGEYGARLREVNIDDDPVLRERYTNDVPILFLGSRKVAKHRVNLTQLRRQLKQGVS